MHKFIIEEFFKDDYSIIVNTDLDGILSGLILKNYLNCKIVGFCNSEEKVYLNESVSSISSPVYIDMFVSDPFSRSIDQHIVAANQYHYNILKKNTRKLNPNLHRSRYHTPSSSYANKYPFGTVHYIIGLLESSGIKINLDFFKIKDGLKFIDFLLRADDSLMTSVDSNYVRNARDWWEWLYFFSNKSKSIEKIGKYIYGTQKTFAHHIKNSISKTLMNPSGFACESSDGGFKSPVGKNGYLKQNVKNYIKFLSEISGLDCFNLEMSFMEFIGKSYRTNLSESQIIELIKFNTINEKKIFSYAFVRSVNREKNFSYTSDIKAITKSIN
ncbi:MAG: hypothetical protein CMC66_02895 [Flavobacteriaceae bacterium]|nr:hypothetical protein [Flavobacteriaceae bacterium]